MLRNLNKHMATRFLKKKICDMTDTIVYAGF